MKFSQIIIALMLGGIAFTGIFMSEQGRQANLTNLQNPFEKTSIIPDEVILESAGEPQTVFSQFRELWQFFPGHQSNFTDGAKEIVDGDTFVSFSFITEQDITLARQYQTTSFAIDSFKPTAGQFTIHNFAVNAPGASLFVERTQAKKLTKIYAYDHAVDVWFPGARQPFVLPAGNYITVLDDATERLGKLYYTKLKKDLRLKSIDDNVAVAITEAIEVKNAKLRDIKSFAESLPYSWYWFNPDSWLGKVAKVVRYLQRDYALGISQQLRQKFFFQEYLTDFLSAHYQYQNNAPRVQVEQSIGRFLQVLNSSDWRQFLVRYPEWQSRWNFLGQNQKVWLHHSFQDDAEYAFAPVWFSSAQGKSLKEIEDAFFQIEEMINNGFTDKARQGLINLEQSVEKLTLESVDGPRVTRLRRLLDNLISQQIALQGEPMFRLHQQLVEQEINLYESQNPAREEIVLENAQNVLYFLKDFIEDRTAGKITQVLVNTYSILEIDQIEERLGRTIFNQAEQDTIKLVQFARSEDLTEDELNELQATKSLQQLIDERFAELEANKQEAVEAALFASDQIDTTKELNQILQEASVATQGLQVDLQGGDDNPAFSFRGAYYNNLPLNGVFSINRQEFSFVKIRDLQEKNVSPRYLASILRRMEKDLIEEAKANQTVTISSRPSQTTPLAILQRKLVQETFEQEGLRLERDDVEIVSTDYNEFEINNALIGKEYRVHFTYAQKEEYVTNLVVEYVRNRFEFGEQVIPRSGIKDFIIDSVLERFKSFEDS